MVAVFGYSSYLNSGTARVRRFNGQLSGLQHLSIESRGEVLIVTIDRPPANALDPELLDEGLAVLDHVRSTRPKAVVITGTGEYFSTGIDLKVAARLSASERSRMLSGVSELLAGWYSLPCPLVSAINGHAVAGGLILALCGDYRIGSDGMFGLTELRVGISYPAAALRIVRAELSASAARRLVLRADLIGQEAALELGIFDELVERGAARERGLELATELASQPPDTYVQTKRALRADA